MTAELRRKVHAEACSDPAMVAYWKCQGIAEEIVQVLNCTLSRGEKGGRGEVDWAADARVEVSYQGNIDKDNMLTVPSENTIHKHHITNCLIPDCQQVVPMTNQGV